MEKVRPWCGQPSDRGRLKNGTELETGKPHRDDCSPYSLDGLSLNLYAAAFSLADVFMGPTSCTAILHLSWSHDQTRLRKV